MARDKEQMQDNLLRQMENVSRKSARETNDVSLKIQLRNRASYDTLSIEQKRALSPKPVWERALIDFMVKKGITTSSYANTICSKYSSKMDEFHSSGEEFKTFQNFFEEKTR